MLAAGDRIPLETRVWLAPRESLSLGELLEPGPLLLLWYLFDWSGT